MQSSEGPLQGCGCIELYRQTGEMPTCYQSRFGPLVYIPKFCPGMLLNCPQALQATILPCIRIHEDLLNLLRELECKGAVSGKIGCGRGRFCATEAQSNHTGKNSEYFVARIKTSLFH